MAKQKNNVLAHAVSDVVDDLKRQHDFVEDQKKRGEDAFSLVSPEAFLRGIRDLGYKSTLTALDELVDNSVQANAQRVWAFPAYVPENKTQKKPDAIVVVDNGHGMEPDMIRIAVRWGGTHRPDDRKGFGRYGFGLPSACVSIGQRYTVYSKVAGGDWHAVEIDVKKVSDQIARGEKAETHVIKKAPPKWVAAKVNVGEFESGTVIVIDNLDRLDSGFKTTQAFVRKLLEHVGVQYRKMMPEVKIVVDDTEAESVDPLFLSENARWYDETPILAEPVEPIQFELAGKDGAMGTIRIRAASFPYNFHLKDPDGPIRRSNHNNRFRVMNANNGIIVCRAGRQIDVVTRLPWTTFVNFDRFWAIEIDFDPTLDEYFGITTSKQQIVFSESLIDILKDKGLEKLIEDLRRAMKKSRAKVKATLERRTKTARASEMAMATAEKRKPRPVNPTAEQVKKAEENLSLQAKKRAEVTGEPVEKAKEEVRNEVKDRPYKVDFEPMPDGPVYRPDRMGPQYRLVINTMHRFYSDVYEVAEKVPGMKAALEAMLFVLGEAEIDATGDREKFYKAERLYGSQRLSDVLADLDEAGDTEDEASAEMEDQEAGEPGESITG